jgi:hypothetical protein
LSAANFFSWDDCKASTKSLWNIVSSYPWGGPPPADFPQYFISALNTHDANQVLALYQSRAAHITAEHTIQGTDSLRDWYTRFFTNIIPNGLFTLTGSSGSGNSRSLTWQATSGTTTFSGSDTFGLQDGKIIYHFSIYKHI